MKKMLSLALAAVLMLSVLVSCNTQKKNELNFGKELLAFESQLDALNGLVKGDADVAVIDSVMANYLLNSVDTYKDYQILNGVVLSEGKYAVAAKKGNEALIGKVNEALIALTQSSYPAIGKKYGLESTLLVESDTKNPLATASDDSWKKVAESGKLVIGYTLYAPIAYYDGDGPDKQLIGFDIELPKAVAEYLNKAYSTSVTVEFQKIAWEEKEALLENGTLDLVWNGLSITPERSEALTLSIPYMANNQVAVIKKADAEKYACTDFDSFKKAVADAIIIVEKGSDAEAAVRPID